MELSQHLRLVLQARHGLLPLDLKAVDRLDAAGAFAGRPALRFIVVTASRGGALSRFASAGEWNDAAVDEMRRFMAHTGFRETLVEGVFAAYAEALGWDVPSGEVAISEAAEPAPAALNVGDFARSAGARELEAVNAAIVIDREKEQARGVTVESCRAVEVSGSRVKCMVSLRRLSAMGSAVLTCAVTDAAGNPVHADTLTTLTVTSPSVMTLSFAIPRLDPAPSSVVVRVG